MHSLPREARSVVTALLRSRRLLSCLLSALLVTATIYGWRTFWFLTDDAFISFRYISNHLNGWGYVWNPPPFRAVEGYSNLLWMIILEVIWRGLDIAPPAACNTLSLLIGLGTLALVWRIARRLELPRPFAADRDLWALLVVAGVVVNRTFLVWLSSGLETALFNFLLLWWFSACLSFSRSPRPATLAPLVAAAGLAALARPDGMLFAAASAAIALAAMVRARPLRPWLPALSPLLVVPLHLLWRFGTYGEWLPNTYYAKHREAWPLAGANYLASFCLEFAWWLFLIPPALLLLRSWRGLLKPVFRAEHLVPTITLGTIVLHVSYFTFFIGGDLFEYRVYSYLVPLLFLSLLWTLGRLAATKIRLAAIFTTLIACTIPIPWVHHFETRDLTGLKNTHVMVRAVAPRFPWPLSIYVPGSTRCKPGSYRTTSGCARRSTRRSTHTRPLSSRRGPTDDRLPRGPISPCSPSMRSACPGGCSPTSPSSTSWASTTGPSPATAARARTRTAEWRTIGSRPRTTSTASSPTCAS